MLDSMLPTRRPLTHSPTRSRPLPRSGRLLLAAGIALLAGGPAAALSLAPTSTGLPAPYVGVLEVIDVTTGIPDGGVVQAVGAGRSADATDISLVFTIQLDPGSDPLSSVGISDVLGRFDALGTIPGADVDTTGLPLDPFFTLIDPDPELLAGEATDPFFVMLSGLELGDEIAFGFTAPTGTSDFTLVVVPEPATSGLVLLGLGALAARRRSARLGARPSRVGSSPGA